MLYPLMANVTLELRVLTPDAFKCKGPPPTELATLAYEFTRLQEDALAIANFANAATATESMMPSSRRPPCPCSTPRAATSNMRHVASRPTGAADVACLTPARVPPQSELGRHRLREGQRLDHLADHYLEDAAGCSGGLPSSTTR